MKQIGHGTQSWRISPLGRKGCNPSLIKILCENCRAFPFHLFRKPTEQVLRPFTVRQSSLFCSDGQHGFGTYTFFGG